MNIEPRIEELKPTNLVGLNLSMSLVNNRTFELWSGVMPILKKLGYPPSANRFSLQLYPKSYFKGFDPSAEFVKWAAVEVDERIDSSGTLNPLTLEGGLYAVFLCKGSENVQEFFQYIYSSWIPKSEYELDDRPHFEILGEKYKNNDPESEEEVWIPIRLQQNKT